MRKRWVSWAAVSSLPQAKKISNEQQLDVNRQHATQHGGEIERLQQELDDKAARGTRRQRLHDAQAIGIAMLDNPDVTAANAWLRRCIRVYVGRSGIESAHWL